MFALKGFLRPSKASQAQLNISPKGCSSPFAGIKSPNFSIPGKGKHGSTLDREELPSRFFEST